LRSEAWLAVNGRMQILLVEDDSEIAERVTRDLGRNGYEVIGVATAEAAHDALASPSTTHTTLGLTSIM